MEFSSQMIVVGKYNNTCNLNIVVESDWVDSFLYKSHFISEKTFFQFFEKGQSQKGPYSGADKKAPPVRHPSHDRNLFDKAF